MSIWVKTADRLPTKTDANECGCVWVFDGEEVRAVSYFHVSTEIDVAWMPRQPVAPPEKP